MEALIMWVWVKVCVLCSVHNLFRSNLSFNWSLEFAKIGLKVV